MNELKVFENPAFGQMRTMSIDNEPWFVGRDVAKALGYGDDGKSATNAVARHVDAEDKGVTEMVTPGGKQNITIINESGLYSLILSSKLPTAREFKHWVTSEVLPSIRKTGGYINPSRAQKYALQEKRLQIMEMNARCRQAEQMRQVWTKAGVEPQYQALALNGFYEGLEVPRIAFKEQTTALFDKTTIAKHLGVFSKKGLPHSQAIGAIISQLTLLPEESAMTPFSRNGHDDQSIQYTKSVEDKAAAWLTAHDYPNPIRLNGKTFTVKYEKEG